LKYVKYNIESTFYSIHKSITELTYIIFGIRASQAYLVAVSYIRFD